eukprot:1160305-Pelagomonas_calceolata.AAC.3
MHEHALPGFQEDSYARQCVSTPHCRPPGSPAQQGYRRAKAAKYSDRASCCQRAHQLMHSHTSACATRVQEHSGKRQHVDAPDCEPPPKGDPCLCDWITGAQWRCAHMPNCQTAPLPSPPGTLPVCHKASLECACKCWQSTTTQLRLSRGSRRTGVTTCTSKLVAADAKCRLLCQQQKGLPLLHA